jgi:hypothetical protein
MRLCESTIGHAAKSASVENVLPTAGCRCPGAPAACAAE